MRKLTFLLFSLTFLLTACEGDPGPPGPPGLNGQNGVNFVGQSFERTVNFTNANGYFADIEIPLDIDLLESDMVLVYRLVGVDNDGFDFWRPLPETAYTDDGGEFQYNFDHNFDFVDIYLYAPPSFDLGSIPEINRIDQIFRIVILPVDFINSNNIDINNFNDVVQYVQ
ncbi:dihydrolipoamide dehydrogenase [Winogradskyella aquimaris]|uniref:Dihydrolipoamide dehydrogenase n=1 Tax=Winogradskyella aquimaris TaxID=864074 RepID=A0ABU5EMN7_9FLAO|nr:dihydrolipoamide dehydrogenase [Winogradskyella aquimaris]MDY2587577.1 dihydrolipoamide dehydrogenase [Winogradskyella aquimaris]